MILDEIAKLIDDNSTSRTVGTNLFKGFAPARAPATATFLHEYPGQAPSLRMGSSTPFFELPRIQVVDRSTDYVTARNASEHWYKLFMGTDNTTLKPSTGATGTWYLALTPLQSPFYLGQDANERHEFAFNVEAMKSLST